MNSLYIFLFFYLSLNPGTKQFEQDSCVLYYTSYEDLKLFNYLNTFNTNLSVSDEVWRHYYYSQYYKSTGEKERQLEHLLDGLELIKQNEIADSITWRYLDELSRTYVLTRDEKSKTLALKYAKDALKMKLLNRASRNHLAKSYYNIGDIFLQLDTSEMRLDSALIYFKRSYENYTRENSKTVMQQNIARIMMEQGKTNGVEKIFIDILSKYRAKNHGQSIASISNNLATLYIKMSQFEKATIVLDTLLDYSIENKWGELAKDVLKNKIALADSLHDYKSKYFWKDSLNTYEQFNNQSIEVQIEKYELEQKLAKEEIKLYRNRLWISVLGGTTGTLLMVLFGFNRYNKLKRRAIQQELETTKVQAALESARARIEGEQHERQAIASKLHDKVASLLTAADVHLKVAEQKPDSHSLEKASSLLKDINMEVRELSHQLASPTLTKFGLAAAIDSLVNKLDSPALKIRFEESIGNSRFDSGKEIFLYRSCSELIQNAMKHSNADSCELNLLKTGDEITLTVSDNGSQLSETKMGHGLTHISTRSEAFGGRLEIESGSQGYIAKINIPISSD